MVARGHLSTVATFQLKIYQSLLFLIQILHTFQVDLRVSIDPHFSNPTFNLTWRMNSASLPLLYPFKTVSNKNGLGKLLWWPVSPQKVVIESLSTMNHIEEGRSVDGPLSFLIHLQRKNPLMLQDQDYNNLLFRLLYYYYMHSKAT